MRLVSRSVQTKAAPSKWPFQSVAKEVSVSSMWNGSGLPWLASRSARLSSRSMIQATPVSLENSPSWLCRLVVSVQDHLLTSQGRCP